MKNNANNTTQITLIFPLFRYNYTKKFKKKFARRYKIRVDHPTQRGMGAVKYPFSQKIRCGCCGTHYVRGQIYSSGEMVPAW